MPQIYIVEDDDNIRELVLYALKAAGLAAQGFAAAEEFWRGMKAVQPDLVLLDIMLPGQDGLAILQALKTNAQTQMLPVILLTAKNGELDRVRGLDLGADDYIAKPFSVLELGSRIKAVLRRANGTPSTDGSLRYDVVELNAQKHTVSVNGEYVTLTYKEFELLKLLLENVGLVFTRDKILSAVWGAEFEGETRTVDMHIKTLRQKLGAGGDAIKTVRGLGYKMGV